MVLVLEFKMCRLMASNVITFYVEVVAQISLDQLRGFWGCWATFIKYFFPINQLLHALFGHRGVFLASNSLHEVRDLKKICLNLKNFEQIQWINLFHRMYGLAVIKVMTMSGHFSNIDEINGSPWVSDFVCCV